MILFFGPPGSGKSVQGQLLVERNHWTWLSTGELFRRSTDPAILRLLASGSLVDDETTSHVLAEALSQLGSTQIVLDGYPRNIHQAQWLEVHLSEYDKAIEAIVVFEVPQDELMGRLLGRARAEDAPGVIEKRLDIYNQRMLPVIEFYKQRQVPMCFVDGLGSVEVVHDRTQRAVETCLHG